MDRGVGVETATGMQVRAQASQAQAQARAQASLNNIFKMLQLPNSRFRGSTDVAGGEMAMAMADGDEPMQVQDMQQPHPHPHAHAHAHAHARPHQRHGSRTLRRYNSCPTSSGMLKRALPRRVAQLRSEGELSSSEAKEGSEGRMGAVRVGHERLRHARKKMRRIAPY